MLLAAVGLMPAHETERACQKMPPEFEQMAVRDISIRTAAGEVVTLTVRIANNSQARTAGYQHVCPETIAETAILFVYSSPISSSFHMNNVHAPLDIAFFDRGGSWMRTLLMHPPPHGEQSKLYDPESPFRYALETAEGRMQKLGIGAGAQLLPLRR